MSTLDGAPCTGGESRKIWRKVGYVPQRKQAGFAYTVGEMVLLGRSAHLGLLSMPGERDRAIAADAMKKTGTTHLAHKLCSRISGGELQMVLVARALASQPELLVLDEPESNLDFRNQRVVLDLIRQLCREQGISSILNTHYPGTRHGALRLRPASKAGGFRSFRRGTRGHDRGESPRRIRSPGLYPYRAAGEPVIHLRHSREPYRLNC